MMKQSESVLAAIQVVKGEITGDLSKGDISAVAEIIVAQIECGEVAFSDEAAAKYDTTEKKFKYVKGMVKNWLTKSLALNGGVKYVPKSKRGPVGDATLKALKALAEAQPDNLEVMEALEAHKAKLEEAKTLKNVKKINVEALPEHLKKFA